MTLLPDNITHEAQLDSVLTTPSMALREFIPQVSNPMVILREGGKMDPTLHALPALGAGGRAFKSRRSDQFQVAAKSSAGVYFNFAKCGVTMRLPLAALESCSASRMPVTSSVRSTG